MRFLNELFIRVLTGLRSERAQTGVEYALVLGVISLALIIALVVLIGATDTVIGSIVDCVDGDALTGCAVPGIV